MGLMEAFFIGTMVGFGLALAVVMYPIRRRRNGQDNIERP